MADATYQPKVYMQQDGDVQVVKSGGEINIETGGTISADGTQASAIAQMTNTSTESANDAMVNVASSTDADVARAVLTNANFEDVMAKVNLIMTALSGVGIIATT